MRSRSASSFLDSTGRSNAAAAHDVGASKTSRESLAGFRQPRMPSFYQELPHAPQHWLLGTGQTAMIVVCCGLY